MYDNPCCIIPELKEGFKLSVTVARGVDGYRLGIVSVLALPTGRPDLGVVGSHPSAMHALAWRPLIFAARR